MKPPAGPTLFRRLVLAIVQHPPGSTFQIVILAAFQRPEEGGKAKAAQKQGDGNEIDERVHEANRVSGASGAAGAAACSTDCGARASRLSLSAFTTTMTEEDDMAMAAMSGVA